MHVSILQKGNHWCIPAVILNKHKQHKQILARKPELLQAIRNYSILELWDSRPGKWLDDQTAENWQR